MKLRRRIHYCLFLVVMTSGIQAQDAWNLYNLGMHFGGSSIAKKADAVGFVFSWDAAVKKGVHMLGLEYETATNMRIAADKYAVDQINLLYGRHLMKAGSAFALDGYVGSGFYRQSNKRIGTNDDWRSATAVGLKLKLTARYLFYKRLYVAVTPNTTFNFSSTYFSVLGGMGYYW